jgi:hypothetical protein
MNFFLGLTGMDQGDLIIMAVLLGGGLVVSAVRLLFGRKR